MKFNYLIIIIWINIICNSAFSQSIVVVNIQYIINNHEGYKSVIKEIENSQAKYLEDFQKKENSLKKILKEIEESKLILSEDEMNIQIDDYNEKLTNFTYLVEEFNIHYQNQIINIRENILNQIIPILETYAVENKTDLILDSTSYLIASNAIDITDDINNKLKKIKLQLNYNDFEKN